MGTRMSGWRWSRGQDVCCHFTRGSISGGRTGGREHSKQAGGSKAWKRRTTMPVDRCMVREQPSRFKGGHGRNRVVSCRMSRTQTQEVTVYVVISRAMAPRVGGRALGRIVSR